MFPASAQFTNHFIGERKKIAFTCFLHDKSRLAYAPCYDRGVHKGFVRFWSSFLLHKSQSQGIAYYFLYSFNQSNVSFLKSDR